MARSGRCAVGALACPGRTEHILSGRATALCLLMIGSRREDGCHYAVNDTAGIGRQ